MFAYCVLNALRWAVRNLVKGITTGKILSYTKQTVNWLCLGAYSKSKGSHNSSEIGRTK